MKMKCYRIERDVLDWLVEQMDSDEIEEVTDEILDSLIEKHTAILAVFCKKISDNMNRLKILEIKCQPSLKFVSMSFDPL